MSALTSFSRRTFLMFPLALAACKSGHQVIEIVGLSMGTTYKVVAVDFAGQSDETQVKGAVSAALSEVIASMSNWERGSEISKFNRLAGGESAAISGDLARVMDAAAEIHTASAGRFDTTVGPLIELWGFGANGTRQMPSEGAIEQARAMSGHDNTLRIGAGTLQKTQGEAQVYLAGIGKGFGADHVGRALESLGIKDYLVEIGGDLYTSGRNPDGQPWQIGIETPSATDSGVYGVVGVSGKGLATSGDYRNYFEEDGRRYSHLIDPATGHPVDHKTASATVMADNAMLADAWSTAMLILGREHGLEIANVNNVAVQFIDRAGTGFEPHASDAFLALTA